MVPPPATPEQTCVRGQTPGPIRRYERLTQPTDVEELGRWTLEASAKYPVDITLGDKAFRVLSPVRRCDGDGRMHFLGAQVDASGLRTIGFTPPAAQYDGFGEATNACQVAVKPYCQATCTEAKSCTDARCRTLHAMPTLSECTNPITHQLAVATEPPTDAQRQQGIREVRVIDELVIREYEADVATGTWKSMVIVRERRREHQR